MGVTTLGHGRIVGSASLRADYDSNIFAANPNTPVVGPDGKLINNTQVSDTVATFTANARYIRDESEVTFESGVGVSAIEPFRHSNQHSIDPTFDAKVGYTPSDKTTFISAVTYSRDTIANEAVNARTKSDDWGYKGSLEQLFSEKLGFRGVVGYSENDYLTASYSNILSYNAGLNLVYLYSPKLKALGGVDYEESWTTHRAVGRHSPSNNDWRYTVGLEGELAPKVNGSISAGLIDRRFNQVGFGNTNALFVSANVAWAAAAKTTWSVSASQDLTLSAADQSVKTSSLVISLNEGINEKLSFEGSAGVDHSDYGAYLGVGSRRDDGYLIRGRLNYALSDSTSFDVSTGYRNTDSSLAASTFDRFNFGAGFTAKF